MLRISIEKKTLHFKQPAGTSRGVYTERDIWLLTMYDTCSPEMLEWGSVRLCQTLVVTLRKTTKSVLGKYVGW